MPKDQANGKMIFRKALYILKYTQDLKSKLNNCKSAALKFSGEEHSGDNSPWAFLPLYNFMHRGTFVFQPIRGCLHCRWPDSVSIQEGKITQICLQPSVKNEH
jgi:hypothetical protein